MDVMKEYEHIIEGFIQDSDKPVVVFSALWPVFRCFDLHPSRVTELFLTTIMKVVGDRRGLLMPTFTAGYKNGLCNLDVEKSKNGILTEMFRLTPGVKRTLSAFFSYGVWSKNADLVNQVTNLAPKFAWGDGSIYEWMEQENVHFIMLGVHPTTCSYLHRIEWLVKDKVDYRYNKPFRGKLIRDGKETEEEENLFVRLLDPVADNDFTTIYDELTMNGMEVNEIKGIPIAHMRAHDMKKVYLSLMEKDPYVALENRDGFIAALNNT